MSKIVYPKLSDFMDWLKEMNQRASINAKKEQEKGINTPRRISENSLSQVLYSQRQTKN